MRKLAIVFVAVFTFCAVGAVVAQTGSQSATQPNTYQWYAELVSYDDATKTMTVRSRFVGKERGGDMADVKAGERVTLVWSGYDTTTDAIRFVRKGEAAGSDTKFLLPAEIVNPNAGSEWNPYVSFKVRIPDGSAAAVKALKAGDWVTVVSPHRPSGATNAIVSVKPYSDTSASRTT